MTEACHGHLGAVHQYPLCGRLSLEEWDSVAPVTECNVGIADKSPAQSPKKGYEEGGGRSTAPSGNTDDDADGQEAYAPGHGPGVATSGSTSVFVSKSRKPRRR